MGGKRAVLPSGNARDVRGGTGFNDAEELGKGVWRDRILPSQTLWYKVPAGWGQQVRYDVEFANEPTVEGAASTYSYGATQLFTPARFPVGGGAEFTSSTLYSGRPAAIRMGSVPVSWTNRYEYRSTVQPVHAGGEFYISVTLGAQAAEIAENARIGVVLRVSVLGDERAGPEDQPPFSPRSRAKERANGPTRRAIRLRPETAAVRAGQDGPALRPLPGRAPWW